MSPIGPRTEHATWTLSGFGDEIDPDPRVQVAVLKALGASHIEVRSAWGVNVIELDDRQLHDLASIFDKAGMRASAIASPIGKVRFDSPADAEVKRLARVIRVAKALDAHYIRVFSYFLEGESPASAREAVLERMSLLARAAEDADVILVHENEKGIYGDTPERVLDIIESVGSDALRVAWDSANFVQVGVQRPHDQGYAMLRPYFEYLQIKDSRAAQGTIVPAGQGDGQVRDTVAALVADGYAGFASLEPHLSSAHALGGFSGPSAFGEAARAFARLAEDEGVEFR